jgi:hypothetical protein
MNGELSSFVSYSVRQPSPLVSESLFCDLVLLDLVEQLLWLSALEMSSHRFQDAVQSFSHSGLEVTRMDLARAVVALETLSISVGHSFLVGGQDKRRESSGEDGKGYPVGRDGELSVVSENNVVSIVNDWIAFHDFRRTECLLDLAVHLREM